MPSERTALTWVGVHSTLRVQRPAPGVVVVTITGTEVGEHGDQPFVELVKDTAAGSFELFVDARDSRGVALEVSGKWARWLAAHRTSLRRVHVLAMSRLVRLTVRFVSNFAALQSVMRVYDDAEVFDGVLAHAVSAAMG